METLEILRLGGGEVETQGVMRKDGICFAVTLEPPWKDNEPDKSCIPAGTYTCKRVKSPHFGNVFEITNVPGRTNILLHKGNQIPETLGCVMVGEKYTELAIGESKEGFDEFMKKFADVDEFHLSIINVNDYLPAEAA